MINKRLIYWLLVISLLLTGCVAGSNSADLPAEELSTASPEPTQTPADTPTPLAPVGVLLTPPGADQGQVDELNSIIGDYIREIGLRFQVLSNLTPDEFQHDDYQIVVVLEPFPELLTLVESAPDTKFLAVGFNDLETRENLSSIKIRGRGL